VSPEEREMLTSWMASLDAADPDPMEIGYTNEHGWTDYGLYKQHRSGMVHDTADDKKLGEGLINSRTILFLILLVIYQLSIININYQSIKCASTVLSRYSMNV
jgi:hypothetical protein